jgi:hypothetical protein
MDLGTQVFTHPQSDIGSTVSSGWSLALKPGPYWGSFEQFRTSGSTTLETIHPNSVGTLSTKTGSYRILRDRDFQRLVGLAAEVHRIKAGVTFVMQAAKVVQKHKDEDTIELLIKSVAMLGESRALPEREGHDRFEITPEEAAENAEDSDLTIPRPAL